MNNIGNNNMTLELVDESDVKNGKKDRKSEIKDQIKADIKNEEINEIKKEIKADIKTGTKGSISLVSKDDMISCERTKSGMANNCALCEVLNTEIFGRCKNKYSGV